MAEERGKSAFVRVMSALWEGDPMKMMIEIMGSLPAVFISTFGLTFHLFRLLDKYVKIRRRRSKILPLLFGVVNSIYITFVITLYDENGHLLCLLSSGHNGLPVHGING